MLAGGDVLNYLTQACEGRPAAAGELLQLLQMVAAGAFVPGP